MMSAPETRLVKLNLGCGHLHPAGWVNVDGSHRAWLASKLSWLDRLLVALWILSPTEFNSSTVYARLDRRFPWADDSADVIYMGGTLEHFIPQQGEHVLRECYRVLKPGGILRINVPDNARFWRQYLKEFDQMRARPRAEWTLDHTRWIEMFFRDICVRRPWLGSMGHYHKWMYDEISLIKTLEQIGFCEVTALPSFQSRIPDITAVEERDDLNVEATKAPARTSTHA
jgi:predicted SAM-dependent methyltransferase